ncbi:MAG: YlcI/YnfO family protein [Bryobacteraceae bacterium]
MPRRSQSSKPAITIDPRVHLKVLEAAAGDGVSVSAWMTTAARMALKRRDGLAAIREWEEEHGHFTEEEMQEARRRVRSEIRALRSAQRSA